MAPGTTPRLQWRVPPSTASPPSSPAAMDMDLELSYLTGVITLLERLHHEHFGTLADDFGGGDGNGRGGGLGRRSRRGAHPDLLPQRDSLLRARGGCPHPPRLRSAPSPASGRGPPNTA